MIALTIAPSHKQYKHITGCARRVVTGYVSGQSESTVLDALTAGSGNSRAAAPID